ncbi:hypothetical protein EMIT0194MI4_10372 [Pseudomonas sp. IT-194MI4]
MIAKAKVVFLATRNHLNHPLQHSFTAMHGSKRPIDMGRHSIERQISDRDRHQCNADRAVVRRAAGVCGAQ